MGVKTEYGGSEAYYCPSADTVFMPPFTSFRDAASFYGVWLHETGHASDAKHRLDPKAIFTAASKAQQAADWMHARQPQSEEIAA